MKKYILLALVFVASSVCAQQIKVKSGKLDFLKGEETITVSYSYDDMEVGKLTEEEYLEKKKADVEKKGDSFEDWEAKWISDRADRYQPKFEELFNDNVGAPQISDEGNYNMHVNTDFTEPGFNIGITRKNASVSLTVVFTDKDGAEKAKVTVVNSSANSFLGTDFDAAYRIQESYAKAGRELAKFIKKQLK
ncbi:MAG: hypothetical protein LBR13_02730 [Dysgonamonadaceae bacterium]|jgi:hypothetical protein|nr:hypothetical protein [Dysgonamonadaceae bacterium]